MIEVRLHGRGGQGSVVASKMLASALLKEGKWAQSFPEFGVERRGQPVTAFLRIDTKPIGAHYKIYKPDHVVILDPTLLGQVNVTDGLKKEGWIIVNSERAPDEIDIKGDFKIATVDATGIAIKYGIGSKAAPIVNTAIIGALVKTTGCVGIKSVLQTIREESPSKPEENAMAAKEAYEKTRTT
ncbi:pyruvate ferredoxin oxidoreductase [candidate division WOR-3 bacterium JGI_Cruoil_03_44_89]|uniref:Pyruvate ferredoxin oxidoreductase n=1 Tax=candidate division WOR-3 bacterium JGI_Cruoil_03_44_89 TaxID=1973748 RepID=A0A235BQK9_UNCW3|nr:MAG: pyruvate ferredoxin oxidoreductase [candidate division WOR-3 bacterium JGI_Cruoil_03_44_89]